MKKVVTLFSIVLLAIQASNAQVTDDRKTNVINVNLTSFLISHYGLSYERVLSDKISVRLYGDLAYFNYKLSDDNIKLNGFGILPEFRYYVSGKGAPYNYFVGLYGVIRRYSLDGSISENNKIYRGNGDFGYYGIGFVNGPQFVIGDWIVIAIPFGFSVGASSVTGDYVYTDPNTNQIERKTPDIPLTGSAIMPRFAIELGIAF